jgi:hypothetical protein
MAARAAETQMNPDIVALQTFLATQRARYHVTNIF